MVVFGRSSDSTLGVLSDSLFEKVGLSLEGDHFHPLEWVGGLVVLGGSQGNQETVSAELNVLCHQLGVHTDQLNRKGVADEFLLNVDSIGNNLDNALGRKLVNELVVQHAGEITVETLVTRDEFVREGKTRHKSSFLEPEDGAETSREEDSLDNAEGDATLGEACLFGIAPLEGPLGLLLDTRDSVDSVQESHLFTSVLDVGINQQGVSFGVDVLDSDLESVEASALGRLKLGHEILGKILVNNSIRSGEESQNVADEVAFVVGKLDPVGHIGTKIDFLGSPEGSFGFLVHFPELWWANST